MKGEREENREMGKKGEEGRLGGGGGNIYV